MKVPTWKTRHNFRGLPQVVPLAMCCFGALIAPPSWGQAPMPPTVPPQDAPAPQPDPFFIALEELSKRYNIAIVAEGTPFPAAAKTGVAPLANTDPAPPGEEQQDPSNQKELSQEEGVQKVAERFDYTAVRQGNVYLLRKRYTNPEDMPDVTPEECFLGLQALTPPNDGFHWNINGEVYRKPHVDEKTVVSWFNYHMRIQGQLAPQYEGFRKAMESVRSSPVDSLAATFYLESHLDRIEGIYKILEYSRPADPILRWQTIGKSPVLGYDNQFHSQDNVRFLPLNDLDRIVVTPYGATVPRPDYTIRYDPVLREPDPTDLVLLSAQTKQFLDDNGRSSRATTLSEAIATLNRRVPKHIGSKVYKVDAAYAAKHVTLAGVDKLDPETLIQSLAEVYGLGVDHRRDDTVVVTTPAFSKAAQEFVQAVIQLDGPTRPSEAQLMARSFLLHIPAPIYRAVQSRIRAARLKMDPTRWLEFKAQFEYQALAAEMRDSAIRMLRYLAEPQVKAQPNHKLALARLGQRARNLFGFARTIAAFADACEVVDLPTPPYITNGTDFLQNVTVTGGVHRAGESPLSPSPPYPPDFSGVAVSNGHYHRQDANLWLSLFLTYTDPRTGVKYGPLLFFDAPLNL